MRHFIGSLVVGSFVLMGVPPIAAGQSVASGAPIGLAADSDSTADRDSYTRKARDEMQEWRQKLHDFGEKAEAKGRASSVAAKHDLNEAWTKTEAEADKLQSASAADWESAKISYEKTSRDLADAWDKIRSEDK